jgi:hypothetical protein
LQFRPTREQGLQRALAFDAGELVAKAEVDAGAEGEMPVGLSLQVEPFGMVVGIQIFLMSFRTCSTGSPLSWGRTEEGPIPLKRNTL